jgi:hypothetical protein
MTARRILLMLALAASASAASAAVTGQVLSSDDKPVAGATVTAYALETAEARAERLVAGQDRRPLATVKTGADGAFRVENDEALLAVGVRAEGSAPAMTTAVRGEALTLRLKPAAVRRGTVTAQGKPVAEAMVVWMAGLGDPQSVELIVRTAKDGAYEVPDPDVWASGLAILHPDFALLSATPSPKWGSTLSHQLTGGAPLPGQVIDGGSGQGLGGAALWVNGWPRAKSAVDGTFTIPHAAPDEKDALARTDAMAGTAKAAGGRLVITAQPVRRLTGQVRDASSKQPIAGAMVAVFDNNHETAANALTDARGEYALPSLPSGRYWVYASRRGYGPDSIGDERSKPVDLRKSLAARHDVDLAPLRRVTGRVLDEQGRPVAVARVSLGWEGMGTLYGDDDESAGMMTHMAGSPEPPSLTAADGSFTLALPAYSEQASSSSGVQGSVLALKRGYAAGRVKLPPPSAAAPVVITLPKGMTVGGRVTAADGTPLGEAAISVAEAGPFFSLRALASEAGRDVATWVRTDAGGRFTLQMNPMVHQVLVHKPGHAPKLVESFDPRAGGDLDVMLDPGVAIRGRILRPDGRGVGGAALILQDGSETAVGTVLSDDTGGFSFADLAAGRYDLQIEKQDAGIHARRTVEAPGPDVRVELGPTFTVRGRVFDAASRAPVPEFAVTVGHDPPSQDGDFPGLRTQAFDAPEGVFVMEDVPAGESTVTVSSDGYRTKEIEGVAIGGDAGAPELEVALELGVSIRGRVSSAGGEPIDDVRVSVRSAQREQEGAETDENGEYELKGLTPGEVMVDFAKSGFRSAHRTVQTLQATRLDVTLSRGLSLNGVVIYEDAGVANAQVYASSSVADADTQTAATDANGLFTLHGLGPGRYNVSARAQDKGKAELRDVDSTSAGALRLVIERSPTAVLSGTVVGLENTPDRPPPMVMVTVQGAEGESAHGIVQMSGAFRIEDAPAGRVTVTANAMLPGGSNRTSQSNELTLAAGSENTTVIEFRDDLVVTGTVTRGGAPLTDAAISFRSDEDRNSSSTTDREGHYQAQLAPGPYRVSVTGRNVSYETEYLAAESGSFDIDITGGALRGRVVEAGTETPVSDVNVSLWRVGGDEKTPLTSLQTNARGAFEAPLLREGRYRVVTAKKGFGQVAREVDLSRGGNADVVLELQPSDGVSVKVTDARDGRALEAIVVVRDTGKRIVANGHAGAEDDGSVLIALADGPYLLSTSANGYGTVTRPITAPARGLQVALTPGGTLVIESPRSLRGRIRLMQPDGEEYVRCWCNGIADIKLSGRRTTVDHVAPGSYTIEFVDEPEGAPPRPIVIQEGQTSTVTIE